jgi:methylglyoxal synthase
MHVKKRIALVAHDSRKSDLINWVNANKEAFSQHEFVGTGTTAKMISEHTGLVVKGLLSGPLGGDMQVASRIVEGEIDMMFFFWDPLTAQPHDPDVKALLRIAVLYDIPVANNIASADFMINSDLMEHQYQRVVIDYSTRIKKEEK